MSYLESLSQQNATAAAMGEYAKLSPKNVDKSLTLSELRHKANKAYLEINSARETMDAEIAKNKSVYHPDVVAKMESEAKSAYNETVRNIKHELRTRLDAVIDAKYQKLAEFTMKAPSAEQLSLLQTFALRTGDVSDTEMQMLIAAVISNYQASAAAKSLLEAHGKTFSLPFNPDERKKKIDEAKARISDSIRDIDDDRAEFTTKEFYAFDGYGGYITDLCEELDSDPSTAVTMPELTILERLENAQEREYGKYTDSLHDSGHGYLTGDMDSLQNSHKIKDFIRRNKTDIATEDEKRREVENAAEKLLEKYEDKPEGEE